MLMLHLPNEHNFRYTVEAILGHRVIQNVQYPGHRSSRLSSIDQANMDQGKILYHVKWEGLDSETDRTWETEENFL